MKRKILTIEDDILMRKTLEDFLTKEGFEVIGAPNGEIGLETIKKEKPDLVVLDIILPKKNGYEVIEEMKKDELMKNIPIVILTNLSSMDDIERALNLGVGNYLVKGDYKLQEIVEKIRSVLK